MKTENKVRIDFITSSDLSEFTGMLNVIISDSDFKDLHGGVITWPDDEGEINFMQFYFTTKPAWN